MEKEENRKYILIPDEIMYKINNMIDLGEDKPYFNLTKKLRELGEPLYVMEGNKIFSNPTLRFPNAILDPNDKIKRPEIRKSIKYKVDNKLFFTEEEIKTLSYVENEYLWESMGLED